jgi:hypothetical protein
MDALRDSQVTNSFGTLPRKGKFTAATAADDAYAAIRLNSRC